MAKRSGFGISAKMILSSTLLVVLTVAGIGIMNDASIQDVYDTAARNTIESFRKAIQHKGETTTLVFAQAVRATLIENADDDITLTVGEMATQDPELELIYVLSRDERVVAYCRVDRRAAEICDPGRYRRASDAAELPAIQDESWQRVEEIWRQRKAADDALVAFELDDEHGLAQLFARPVFSGGQAPTPAAALDPEPGENRQDHGVQGYVVLAYSLDFIERFRAESQALKKSARRSLVLQTLALGGLFWLIGTVLALFQGLSISRRLATLAWKAEQIAGGDLGARVEVSSSDEIGVLGQNVNSMADRLAVLLRESREKAFLEKEREVARTIQETLVPPSEPVDCGLFNFAGFSQPAPQCGGDWWTHHLLENNKLLLVIGDVTGHGVPAAMIMAAAKASCDVARAVQGDGMTVTTLLEIMNSAIYQSARRRLVMTCFAAVIDLKSRVITYANAGHNFPYLYRVGEDGRGEFGSLMIRGNRLGDLKESQYESTSTQLRPGDTLIWYTDGIVECESLGGGEYGEKRFRASIRRAAHLGAGDLRNALVSDAMSFYGDVPRKDDITLIVGRVT